MTKIDKMKQFHNWLYERVKNVHPMTPEAFDNIIEKI